MDWKRKLSSRKFWMAVVGLVSGIMVFCGRSEQEAQQIGGIIMSAASVVAYILSEGMIDAANAGYIYEDPEESEGSPDAE